MGTIAETGGDAALKGRPGVMDDVFVTLGLHPSAVVTLDSFDAKFSRTLGLRHTAGAP